MNSHTESPSRLTLSRFFTWSLGFLLASSMSFAGVASPPVIEMALSPDTVGIGSTTELTITVDNTVNPGPISQLAFTLPMPAGVTVRALSSECGGTLTTENNGSLLRFSGGAVETSSTCEIKALVTQNIRGPHNLTIDDFTSEVGPSAPAFTTLFTSSELVLGFSKRFVPDLVPLGGRSTLIYTIENQGTADAYNLSFSDFFPPGIAIATPPSVSTNCPGISITAINGTQAIEVSPEDPIPLPAGETCTLTLEVVGVAPGIHLSVSSNLTAVGAIGGDQVSGGLAVAELEVIDPSSILNVSFEKEFLDNPIAPGESGTLLFSITNNSATDTITNLQFTDDLEATLSGLVATEIPTSGGAIVQTGFDGDAGGGGPLITEAWDYLDRIENENGNSDGYPVDQNGNAWNSVGFDVATSNIGPWESEDVPIQVGGIDGFPGAPDLLFGIGAAANGQNLITTYLFRNTFEISADQLTETEWLANYLLDDGGVIYINGTEVFRTPSMPAGAIETTTLSGLGDESGFLTGNLNLSGVLVEGTNSIAVEVHQNTLESSDVGFQVQLLPGSQAVAGGFTYVDDPFQDTADPDFSSGEVDPTGGFQGGALQVQTGGQNFFANFFSPESSGGWSREFTLEETALTTINFRYRLNVAGDFDNNEYGEAVLTVDGIRYGDGPDNSLLRFNGSNDNQVASDSGWREASIEIPLNAGTHTLVIGAYANRTTSETEVAQAWFDNFSIEVPEINIEPCGPGSSISGTNLLLIEGGSLAPGQTCSFPVEVTVPINAAFGPHLNVTSRLSADVNGEPKIGLPATDTLVVEPVAPTISKAFTPNAISAGGQSRVTYTIDNTASAIDARDLAFSDVLPEGLSMAGGDVAPGVALPVETFNCGEGGIFSLSSSTNTFTVSGSAVVPAGAICTISFEVATSNASAGIYGSTTSELTSSLGVSPGASADLTLVAPPLFTQEFSPDFNAGQVGILTFTIDNSTSPLDATNLSFTNTLPDGLILSNPVNFSSTCVGGTASAGPGGSLLSYSNGTVPAGGRCTLQVEVTSLEGGTFVNTTGELTSSLGSSGPSVDTLIVSPIVNVSLSQSESADPIIAGTGGLTYTVLVTNQGPSTATELTISEDLDILTSGVSIAGITPDQGVYNKGVWTLPSLPAGTTASLTVSLSVDPAANEGVEVITSTATLTGVTQTNIATATSVSDATSIITRSDLQVTNMGLNNPVTAGSGPLNLEYMVTVTNLGPSFASNVSLENSLNLPPGVTLEETEPLAGTNTESTGESVIWSVGDLSVGSTSLVRLRFTVGPSTEAGADVITNVASVVSVEQTDVNPQNNTVSSSTSVRREADITIEVAESRDPVLAGYSESGSPGNLSHVISVSNSGPSDASNLAIRLESISPPGTTIVSFGPGEATLPPVLSIADLARGETITYGILYDVSSIAPAGIDTIVSSAELVSFEGEIINPEDDSDSVATSVISPESMEIGVGSITLDLQTALLKQTITVTNNNPLDIPAFRVLVNGLPGDVTVHNAQGASGGAPFLLYNQPLAAGESIDLVVEYFQITASGGFQPEFQIELVDSAGEAFSIAGIELNRVASLPNEDKLLEFVSTVGEVYTIQYSRDGENWLNVVPDIIAGANVTQWVDNGPPKTSSHPSTTGNRFYRVIRKAP
ncbi:MAG: DUF11 domain-containing protein [Verrucomicrobia bacterium]|nr:MAG: DUF11 domain-containing protein [Verrucomicrobiota bacterium]